MRASFALGLAAALLAPAAAALPPPPAGAGCALQGTFRCEAQAGSARAEAGADVDPAWLFLCDAPLAEQAVCLLGVARLDGSAEAGDLPACSAVPGVGCASPWAAFDTAGLACAAEDPAACVVFGCTADLPPSRCGNAGVGVGFR